MDCREQLHLEAESREGSRAEVEVFRYQKLERRARVTESEQRDAAWLWLVLGMGKKGGDEAGSGNAQSSWSLKPLAVRTVLRGTAD